MTESDQLQAIEIELELRRRAKERAGTTGEVTEAPLPFRIGSAVKEAIPEGMRRPVAGVANVLRQGPELAALLSGAVLSPNVAMLRAQGKDADYFGLFKGMSEAGDVAFGEPSKFERFLGSMGLGAGTGAMTKSLGPVRGTVFGGLGHLGAETGQTVGKPAGAMASRFLGTDKESSEKVGEVGGGLLMSALFGAPSLLPRVTSSTANRIASESLKGLSPAKRAEMVAMQEAMQKAGIFSLPSQLDEVRSPTMRALEQSVLSANVGKGTLERNIENILPQSRNFASRVTDTLGRSDSSLRRANEIQDVIELVVDLPRQRAREAARPFYEMLRQDRPQLSIDSRFKIANELADLDEQVGLLERSFSGEALKGVERTVAKDSSILRPTKGNPPFRMAEGDIYKIDNYLKELRTRINSISGLNADSKAAVEAAGLRPALGKIRSTLIEESPTLKAAKNAYETTRDRGLQEVRSTGLPAARPLNMQPGPLTPAAKWQQFDSIMNQGNADDVRRAASLMRGRDNAAFRDVVKNWLKRQHDASFMQGSGNLSEPKVFAEKLLSHPNLDAMIEEAAKGVKGVDPTEFAIGFKKAVRILQAAGRPVQPSAGIDIQTVAKSDPASLIGRFGVVHELGRKAMLASKYFEWAQNKQWQKLYDVLDSQDSMRKLMQMSHMAEMNPKSAAFLSSIVGGTVAID